MNEQELMNNIENASTMEEVWEVASKAGMDRASFDALVEAADKDQGDEISDAELENVNGGCWSLVIGAGMYVTYKVGKKLYKKIKAFRKKREQDAFEEWIMSDNRLLGTCENK